MTSYSNPIMPFVPVQKEWKPSRYYINEAFSYGIPTKSTCEDPIPYTNVGSFSVSGPVHACCSGQCAFGNVDVNNLLTRDVMTRTNQLDIHSYSYPHGGSGPLFAGRGDKFQQKIPVDSYMRGVTTRTFKPCDVLSGVSFDTSQYLPCNIQYPQTICPTYIVHGGDATRNYRQPIEQPCQSYKPINA